MSTTGKKIPRVSLPEDVGLDTLAVREGLPAGKFPVAFEVGAGGAKREKEGVIALGDGREKISALVAIER